MKHNQSRSHNMTNRKENNNNNGIGRPCKLTAPLLLACTLLLTDCCAAVNNSSMQAVKESTGELLANISLHIYIYKHKAKRDPPYSLNKP